MPVPMDIVKNKLKTLSNIDIEHCISNKPKLHTYSTIRTNETLKYILSQGMKDH